MLAFFIAKKSKSNFNLYIILYLKRHWRKALKVTHFGFPLSAGPENGQGTAPFNQEKSFNPKNLLNSNILTINHHHCKLFERFTGNLAL